MLYKEKNDSNFFESIRPDFNLNFYFIISTIKLYLRVMSLENINQTDRIRKFSLSNCKDNSTMNTPNKDILFPKQPNKRYQTFILKEKQKHDENWEDRLKDQNLTDHNFFLNYYSYGKSNKIPSNFSIELENNSSFPSLNDQISIQTKNVHNNINDQSIEKEEKKKS